MNNKFKALIKDMLISNKLLSLDYIYRRDDTFIVGGWCGHKNSIVKKPPSVKVDGNEIPIKTITISRSDVVEHFSFSDPKNCIGFVSIFNLPKDQLDSLLFVHMGREFYLRDFDVLSFDNIDDIVPHIGSDSKKAVDFLSSEGFFFSDKTISNVNNSKVLDINLEKIKNLLEGLDIHDKDFHSKCLNHIIPTIHEIWDARQSQHNDSTVHCFGPEISSPVLSIVIPIYGRYDFIRHQVAQFSSDHDFNNIELIYVIDDPSLIHEVLVSCHGIYQTFNLPFKVVISQYNLGFSGANNLGVQYSSSEHLLLLNSDVLPSQKGWIQDFLTQYNELNNCGILGATLVYEDHTIQHAGMEFRREPSYPGVWFNHHTLKGVPYCLYKNTGVSEVQLVTGACMLIKRSLFDEVNGFDTLYVLGDFEDSDLCLKCINLGYKIYISRDIVLYHLERLSQNLVDRGDWKFKLTLANGVYQSDKWEALIEKVVA